jgi:SAM-dependent methyltransferase
LAARDDEYGAITARYYDGAYERLRGGSGDVEFYRELAREAAGPVLELGCGTGRVLLPIAALGIPCTGLDASPRMLAALRARPIPPTLRLVHAPMQRFDLGEDRFTLVYSAFRAFQHLLDVDEQLDCLACVRRHLAPGGAFAFDVFAPRYPRLGQLHEPEAEDVRFELDGEQVVRYTAVDRDYASQVLTAHMRYERRQGAQVLGSDTVDIRMRWLHRFELEHLLARAGFEDVRIYGGFDRRPYDHDSGEQVVIAR